MARQRARPAGLERGRSQNIRQDWRNKMRSVLLFFGFLLMLVHLIAAPALAATISQNPSGGAGLGYSCSTDDLPGDHIPGRSCKCTGGWESADCKKMLAEVCVSKNLDDQFSICGGKIGGPVENCECAWKRTFAPLTMKMQLLSPGTVMAPAN